MGYPHSCNQFMPFVRTPANAASMVSKRKVFFHAAGLTRPASVDHEANFRTLTHIRPQGEIIQPDKGTVSCERSVRFARLAQEVPAEINGTIYDVVAEEWNHEHELDHPVEKTISQLGLDPHQLFSTLSGGMRRRALLARALVNEPWIGLCWVNSA